MKTAIKILIELLFIKQCIYAYNIAKNFRFPKIIFIFVIRFKFKFKNIDKSIDVDFPLKRIFTEVRKI